MSHNLCIETICVENRLLKNVAYHDVRLNTTRKKLWGCSDLWRLSDLPIPESITNARHKLRIVYGEKIEDIQWELHVPRAIRTIKKVYHDDVDYAFKYNDRSVLGKLFAQRGSADEILIIKSGMVTDSFYCNVAFRAGGSWFTPRTNLLPGTQRAFLLDSGVLQEADISENQIQNYSHIRLFNALMDWDSAAELEIGLVG